MDNKIQEKGVDLLAEKVVDLLDLISKKAPNFLIDKFNNGKMTFNKGLPEYLSAQYAKCGTVRTLLKRDSPTILDMVYEPHRFRKDREEITEDNVHYDIENKYQRTIISGKAGSGKSIFLKKLYRKLMQSKVMYYPIFFEFRTMDIDGKGSVLDAIFESIQAFSEDFTRKQFNFGLKKGLFYFLIDALDEAPNSKRKNISDEIVAIAQKYPKCPLVLTSRPNEDFSIWEDFHVAHLLPFTQSQCESFIKKIDYHQDKKNEFLEFIQKGTFEKHAEFLSNPLLASMMLLTYDEYGDIPQRRHVFYDKCFQVLLREHDSSKGKYRRQFKSKLSYEELEEVFMYFCTFSYLDSQFSFNINSLTGYIKSALEASGLECDIEDISFDFIESISIIQKDGGEYEFTHRSFQEYFYAKFVVKDRDIPLVGKITELSDDFGSEGIVEIIADMDRNYFEREFLLKIVTSIFKEVKEINLDEYPEKIMGKFFAWVRIEEYNERENNESTEKQFNIILFVTHNEFEYPSRKLNLILLKFMREYHSKKGNSIQRKANPLTKEDILKAFNINDIPKDLRTLEFKINHHNRNKLKQLNCQNYANQVYQEIKMLYEDLKVVTTNRRSKLTEKILAKKLK